MMSHYPRQTRASKLGSSLKRHNTLVAAEERAIETRHKPLRRAQAKFIRQRRGVLTKPVVREASRVFQAHKDALAKVFLKARGDAEKLATAKRRTQKALDETLRRELPQYKQFKALQRSYADESGHLFNQQLAENLGNHLDLSLGGVLTENVEVDEFVPTFSEHDVTTIDFDDLLVHNTSFAEPTSGVVVNDIEFRHNEDRFGHFYNPFLWIFTRSSVGITYRIPKTGFLSLAAVIQNLYNKVMFSVSDNFGLSFAALDIVHALHLFIVRSGELTPFEEIVLTTGFVSHSADFSLSTSEIQNSTPFTLSVRTKDAFLKGETIQILAGAKLFIRSDLDDMESFVRAVMLWQVKKIAVSVV